MSAFYNIIFENTYTSLNLNSDDILLDAGANVGLFSVYAAAQCNKVIAVEPSQENFAVLILNKSLNRASNIIPVNRALWDSSGYVSMIGHGVTFKVIPSESRIDDSQYVPCTTIDKLLDELDCSVDAVKMDVEGAERYCLEGEYLRSVREIVIETHETTDHTLKLLKKHGFSTRIISFKYAQIVRNVLRHLPTFSAAELSTKLAATRWSITAMLNGRRIIPPEENLDIQIVYGRKP